MLKRTRKRKSLYFPKSLRWNKSLKVIRFAFVIYCFINTLERNLFSIEAFGFQTDPKLFLRRTRSAWKFSFYPAHIWNKSLKAMNTFTNSCAMLYLPTRVFVEFSLRILMWTKIELHNLCFRLANGHFQFQAVACIHKNENELALISHRVKTGSTKQKIYSAEA